MVLTVSDLHLAYILSLSPSYSHPTISLCSPCHHHRWSVSSQRKYGGSTEGLRRHHSVGIALVWGWYGQTYCIVLKIKYLYISERNRFLSRSYIELHYNMLQRYPYQLRSLVPMAKIQTFFDMHTKKGGTIYVLTGVTYPPGAPEGAPLWLTIW